MLIFLTTHPPVCCVQYSLWLDQQTMPEVLRYIKSALEACSADAKDEQGYEEVYPIMYKLCAYSG